MSLGNFVLASAGVIILFSVLTWFIPFEIEPGTTTPPPPEPQTDTIYIETIRIDTVYLDTLYLPVWDAWHEPHNIPL